MGPAAQTCRASACCVEPPAFAAVLSGCCRIGSLVARLPAQLAHCSPAGDHLLTTAKLSLLNQMAAPLLGAGARLFIAAALPAATASGTSGTSGDSGTGAAEQPSLPCLLQLLAALRQVKTVCTKSAAASAAAPAGCIAAWMPCSQFLQELEQQQQAELQRRAEAAALAAAEAARQKKLQAAARGRLSKDRPQSQEQVPDAPTQHASQQPQPQKTEQPAGGNARQPHAHARPGTQRMMGTQPAAPLQQEQVQQQAARAVASIRPADGAEMPVQQAAPATQAKQGGAREANCNGSSLEHLRQQFQSLYAAVAVQPCPAGTAGAGQPANPADCPQDAAGEPGDGHAASPSSAAQRRQQGQARSIAQGVAAADDIATHVAALRMQAAAEAQRALLAQQELLGSEQAGVAGAASSPGDASGLAAAAEPADAVFAWTPGTSRGSRPGSGSLGQKLEAELLQLEQEAAARAAGAATPEHSGANQASLADLEGGLPSLAAVFRGATSGAAAGTASTGLRSARIGARGTATAAGLSGSARPAGAPLKTLLGAPQPPEYQTSHQTCSSPAARRSLLPRGPPQDGQQRARARGAGSRQPAMAMPAGRLAGPLRAPAAAAVGLDGTVMGCNTACSTWTNRSSRPGRLAAAKGAAAPAHTPPPGGSGQPATC